ncbi:hypothetical protein LMG29542_07326 [Paraburkholderia humisilvae]|uniref:Uncharacterized protein n=2 Tax=Paraburkholderia humisilvae TaxID=627669 RepID=A0A6J5F7I4_9BURK|nr:hypothetical protein LMG29542_07326 [Paraburkholderia humisilvae]
MTSSTRINLNSGQSNLEKLPPEFLQTISSKLSSPKDRIALANASKTLQRQLASEKSAAMRTLADLKAHDIHRSPTFKAVVTDKNTAFAKIMEEADKRDVSPLNSPKLGYRADIQQQQRNEIFINELTQHYPDLSIGILKFADGAGALMIANRSVKPDRPATLYVTAADASQTIRSSDIFKNQVPVSATLPEGHKIGNHNNAHTKFNVAIANGCHGKGAQYESDQGIPEQALNVRGYHEKHFKTTVHGAATALTRKGADIKEPAIFTMPMPGQSILLSQAIKTIASKFPVKHVVVHADRGPDERQIKELNKKREIPGARGFGAILGTIAGGIAISPLAVTSQNNSPDSDYSKADAMVRYAEAGRIAGKQLFSRSVKYDAPARDPLFSQS